MIKTINILGVTGSIGQATCDVILAHRSLFDVRLITAHTNRDGLAQAKEKLSAKRAILTCEESAQDYLKEKVDITVCAMAGMAGLGSMIKAIQNSHVVLIANKEPLVAAGPIVMKIASEFGTKILPLDSEHNAIFQVLDNSNKKSVKRIILTASGGPFRAWSYEQMQSATPQQALAHPNWSMGDKISIDSATMMNKALEIIEAHYLFDLQPQEIDVVIHPQSVVHSMVEYEDGSILAQMGASDMRTPISHALNWPHRLKTPGKTLDILSLTRLDFEKPDTQKFPAIELAYKCLHKGLNACVAMNAANEVAVEAFLKKQIGFLDIVDGVAHIIEASDLTENTKTLDSIEKIQDFDTRIRESTRAFLNLR